MKQNKLNLRFRRYFVIVTAAVVIAHTCCSRALSVFLFVSHRVLFFWCFYITLSLWQVTAIIIVLLRLRTKSRIFFDFQRWLQSAYNWNWKFSKALWSAYECEYNVHTTHGRRWMWMDRWMARHSTVQHSPVQHRQESNNGKGKAPPKCQQQQKQKTVENAFYVLSVCRVLAGSVRAILCEWCLYVRILLLLLALMMMTMTTFWMWVCCLPASLLLYSTGGKCV